MGLLKQRLSDTYYVALKDIRPFKTDQKRLMRFKDDCDAECEVQDGGG